MSNVAVAVAIAIATTRPLRRTVKRRVVSIPYLLKSIGPYVGESSSRRRHASMRDISINRYAATESTDHIRVRIPYY
jgi:hypothetical protein